MHAMAMEALSDRNAFARLFGLHNSLPKYADMDWRPDEPADRRTVRAMLAQGVPPGRHPASRFASIRPGEPALLLFADGPGFDSAGDAALLARPPCRATMTVVEGKLAASPAVVAQIRRATGRGGGLG